MSGISCGKEALLDFASNLHFAFGALALGGFGGEGVGQLADFESEAGLARDGLQHLQIGAGPGCFRALGAESHDAHQAIAAGQRHEQLGVEQIEGATLGACPPSGTRHRDRCGRAARAHWN